jgi:hypothetical protein
MSPSLLGLGLQDLEDQLLLAEPREALDAEVARKRVEIRNPFSFSSVRMSPPVRPDVVVPSSLGLGSAGISGMTTRSRSGPGF